MLRLDKAIYLSLLYRFILSEIFSNCLQGSDALLFQELRNVVTIPFCNFYEFIILLCTFLVAW